MLRRRDFSLVGGRFRLTTPTGSPSDELFESDPQSVTDSGDIPAPPPTSRSDTLETPEAMSRDEVEEFDPPPPPAVSSWSAATGVVADGESGDESGRTSIMDGSASRNR